MSAQTTKIEIELTDAEAWAFAQFLKRAGFSTWQRHSDQSNEQEPAEMAAAGYAIRRAINKAGFDPR